MSEFEIYGVGFVPLARYTSNVFDLGEKLNLGNLTWEGHQEPDTQVELRMRSGDDDDPNIYWRNTFRGAERVSYSASGAPLTRTQYERLEGVETPFTVTHINAHSFSIKLSNPINIEHTDELLEIKFWAHIFSYDTPFAGSLFVSATPREVPQAIRPGDADERSNTLRVALDRIPENPIQLMRLSPQIFSPNSDGVNDLVQIEYELLNRSNAPPAALRVYDLAGRQVCAMLGDPAESGLFHAEWDGRNNQGALLPPGLYVLQLEIEADKHTDRSQRLVALV